MLSTGTSTRSDSALTTAVNADLDLLIVTVPEWLCQRCAVGQVGSVPFSVIKVRSSLDQGGSRLDQC